MKIKLLSTWTMRRHLYPIDPVTGKKDKTLTIWEKICDLENLRLAHKNASRGKSKYKEVKDFNKDPERYLKEIQNMLVFKTYHPLPYDKFERCERGKVREIYKSHYFPERVIQWAVLQVISPILLRQYISNTYSAIPNRGIHLALKDIQRDMLADPQGTKYCAKLDVKKYYPSIDRNILMDYYRHIFKDEGLLWYLDLNIREAPDTGILIGNYLSQFGGNYYLTPFDHWLKEVKGVKYYYRYMDDLVILHESKEYLHQLVREIIEYLSGIHLTVKQNWQVFPTADRGVDFVGYRVFLDFILLRKSTKERMKRKMLEMKAKVDAGKELSYSDYCRFNSYKGWLIHCNGHRLYDKYFKPLENAINCYYEQHLNKKNKKNKEVGLNEANRKSAVHSKTEWQDRFRPKPRLCVLQC